MARHYGSKKGSMWTEHADKFNDEHKHQKSSMRSGPVASGMYEGPSSRRHQEMMDAGMIHEDHSEIANLPQNVMIKPYPKTGPYLPEDLDDTIRGVDEQMDYDDKKRASHFYPKKV